MLNLRAKVIVTSRAPEIRWCKEQCRALTSALVPFCSASLHLLQLGFELWEKTAYDLEMTKCGFSDPNNPDKRVLLLADRIIYVKEVESPTPETVSEGAKEVTRLSAPWERFSILVEFPNLVVPSSETRHRVCLEVLPLMERLDHVAVVTPASVFMKVTIKFVTAFSGFKNISVHKTRESAFHHLTTLNTNRPVQ